MISKSMLALTLAATVPLAPALLTAAQARSHRNDRNDYNSHGEYREPRQVSSKERVWRGKDGHYHCRRSNGTTGLIIGGAAGAVAGNAIDGGSNRTLGTVIGAVGGALAGRSLDRSNMKCR